MSSFRGTSGEKVCDVTKVIDVAQLPEDKHWLPVSIVAYQFRVSTQTIRNLHRTGQINCYQFPTGPQLFSPEEVELVAGV